MSLDYLRMPSLNLQKSQNPSDLLSRSQDRCGEFCLIPLNSTGCKVMVQRPTFNYGEFAIIKSVAFKNPSPVDRLNRIAIHQMQTLTDAQVRSLPGSIGKEAQE